MLGSRTATRKWVQINALNAVKMGIKPSLKVRLLKGETRFGDELTVSEGRSLSPAPLPPHSSGHPEAQSLPKLRTIE